MNTYIFRWIAGWTCYYIGDGLSRLPGWLAVIWIRPYNWFMIMSSNLDHNDLGIWHPSEDCLPVVKDEDNI
jgi:hypothetical protein